MMGSRVMFREIISLIQTSLFPHYVELSLTDPVSDPVKAHINGFGSFLLYSVIGYAGSGAVVGHDDCGRLGVAKFF